MNVNKTDDRIHVVEEPDDNRFNAIRHEIQTSRDVVARLGLPIPSDLTDMMTLMRRMVGFMKNIYGKRGHDVLPTLHAMTANDDHIVATLGMLFADGVSDEERNASLETFFKANDVVAYCYFSEAYMTKVEIDHIPTDEDVEEIHKRADAGTLEKNEIALFHGETLQRMAVVAFELTKVDDDNVLMGDEPAFHKGFVKGQPGAPVSQPLLTTPTLH